MSRRKQGKPQQRKTIDSLEQENDLLVCGDCQTNFPLRDIQKFIKHKVHRCNKENISVLDSEAEYDDDDDSGTEAISQIGSKQPSISAPIARKEALDTKHSPRSSEPMKELNRTLDSGHSNKRKEEDNGSQDLRISLPLKPTKQVADAESNTTHSEPSKFVCGTCKTTVNSAWSLVQHVQSIHGMKIYLPASELSVQLSNLSTPSPKAPSDHVMTPPTPNTADALPHPPHPFMFRMPFDRQHQLPPGPALSPFNRPPTGPDFRLDLLNDPFHSRSVQGLSNISSAFDVPPPFPAPFSDRPRIMETIDFYSQRLRQLASTQTPPLRKPTPPFSQTPSTFTSITPTPSHSQDSLPKNLSPASKLKSCEFCGKCFRFQSNLIVHRRSHTGEKPFKCPICPHACTQASKLKRHMKTHLNKSPLSSMSQTSNISNASEGSVPSSSSTPDSNKHMIKHNDSNIDLDNEEENEEEEEEELEEELEEDDDLEGMETVHNGSPDPLDCHVSKNRDDHSSQERRTPNERSKDLSHMPGAGEKSLLSEVMENTGLNNIQQYNEAFQQALAENIHNKDSTKVEEDGSEGTENGDRDIKSEDTDVSYTSQEKPEPLDCSESPYTKRIKTEPLEIVNSMESIYSNMWLPSSHHQEYFLSGLSARLSDPNHNSFNSPSESALKPNLTSHPKAGPSSNSTPSNGGPISNRKDRRNDTCEFCGKVFKNCSNLTVHRRSHTGEKPYKCELCSYACAQSSKLTRHMKTHGRIGKDVYRCKFCSMPFSVPSTLEKHMRKCVENRQVRAVQETDTDTNSTTTSTL
ncbi:B-cell lymphoma/leukemia 11A [Octopus bimaculoides]|nr:B-cell lymphoma/leukemia 11A [Octopus bimaculoides]